MVNIRKVITAEDLGLEPSRDALWVYRNSLIKALNEAGLTDQNYNFIVSGAPEGKMVVRLEGAESKVLKVLEVWHYHDDSPESFNEDDAREVWGF
jgi:hypothetical protein